MGEINDRVEAARRNENPAVICRVRSGFATLADMQFPRGWCVLLPDPVPASLNAMPIEHRGQYLTDMAALGDAILAATDALRINYSIFGNLAPELHAHVVPRYADEDESMRTKPHWLYPQEKTFAVTFDSERDRPLMEAIARHLRDAGVAVD